MKRSNSNTFRILRNIALLVVVGSSALRAQASGAAPALVHRLIIILVDKTKSFEKNLPEANQAIRRIEANLGPMDRLIVAEIGTDFVPRDQARETSFPEVLPNVFRSANATEYARAKKQLSRVWAESEALKPELSHVLDKPTSINVAYTDIYTPLAYSSDRFRAFTGEKYLVILSDLMTDLKGGLKTDGPPSRSMGWQGVKATALFVPWQSSRKNEVRMKAWKVWFAAGGGEFDQWDELQSKSVMVVPQNSVPRVPGNPLRSAVPGR